MCHRRRIPRKGAHDPNPIPRRGVYCSARTGEANPPILVSGIRTKLGMLGIEVTDGMMPKKEDIHAAISFVCSVTPKSPASSRLEAEHLVVLSTAVAYLEQRHWDVEEVKEMTVELLQHHTIDKDLLREKATKLFAHLK